MPAPALSWTGAGVAGHRHRLLEGLAGEVIEVGAGNGLNLAHYPQQVTRVLAVEPEPHLTQVAGRNAGAAPVPVQVVSGAAERLPAADGSFDAAVACLTLCSVADQAVALADLRRVLRPGGQLRFLEHVHAGTAGMRRVQRLLDATIWPASEAATPAVTRPPQSPAPVSASTGWSSSPSPRRRSHRRSRPTSWAPRRGWAADGRQAPDKGHVAQRQGSQRLR